MVNYACAFSQSELGKYFEWTIIIVIIIIIVIAIVSVIVIVNTVMSFSLLSMNPRDTKSQSPVNTQVCELLIKWVSHSLVARAWKVDNFFLHIGRNVFFDQDEKSSSICKVLLPPEITEFSARQFASVSHFTLSIVLQLVKTKQKQKFAQEL